MALRLVFPPQPWHAGVGDHLMRAMVISSWQKAHPGEPVHLCLQTPEGQALLNWPGATYVKHPTEDFLNVWPLSAWGDTRRLFEALGVDWSTKRLHYWPTPEEMARASLIWGDTHVRIPTRVVLQLSGGMNVKRYSGWPEVVRLLQDAGLNLVALDRAGSWPDCPVPVYRGNELRMALALAASADCFLGFDSGPFYAALGAGVPAVGLFPCAWPEQLFEPILDADYFAHECGGNPDLVPPKALVEDVLRLLP